MKKLFPTAELLSRKPRPSSSSHLPSSIFHLFLALLLAAAQLLPTAELLTQSQRAAGADLDFVLTYSFWPWRFLTLLAPNLFGTPVHGTYWGYANFWEDAVYLGLLPLLLALGLAFRRRPPQAALVRFLTAVIALSFLLALGKNTPVFPWLYHHVPTFDLFQAPTRFTLWAEFALALLAGLGAQTWSRPAGPKARARLSRGVASALAVILATTAAAFFLQGRARTFLWPTAWAGLLALGAATLALSLPRDPKPNGPWPWAVAALLSLDLLVAGWGLNPTVPLEFYRPRPVQPAAGRRYLPPADNYTLMFSRFFRFATFAVDWADLRETRLPNLNLLDGLPSANNFDPLLPARYVRWMDTLPEADAASQARLLALMGVATLQTLPREIRASRLIPLPAASRVWWTPCALPAAGEEAAWKMVFSGKAEVEGAVVLEGFDNAQPKGAEIGHPEQTRPCLPGGEAAPRLASETPNELVIEVSAERAGWLVVADVWYPGWSAEIDGDPAPVLRANYLFRGVAVPAGAHQVRLVYRPLSFYFGAGLSALGWTLWLWLWRRRD